MFIPRSIRVCDGIILPVLRYLLKHLWAFYGEF